MKYKVNHVKLIKKDMQRNWSLYLMILPIFVFYLLFEYKPMYGALIAFQDYRPAKGFGDEWVGFKHFIRFFKNPFFFQLLRNTLRINILNLVFGFPIPVMLALVLNELKPSKYKTVMQIIMYLPHFISVVVIVGMLSSFSLSDGLFNDIIASFGGQRRPLLQDKTIYLVEYVGSGVWQSFGWGTIIYIAALSGIDKELYDAASVDGAGRWKQTMHITLPGIAPTIITMLILRMGSMLSIGYNKTLLLANNAVMEVADVIGTYVYRTGLQDKQWSYSTAISLFNNIVNIILLVTANKVSRKVSETSLW